MLTLKIGVTAVLIVLWAGAVSAAQVAPVPQTGILVLSHDANEPPRDDGALLKGVTLPTPRFTDNLNGTITDNLTRLIWLKNANCPVFGRTWQDALDDVAQLNTSGTMNANDCGDTSGKRGSHQTDWRLPNIRELFSLVDFSFWHPALSNAAGTGHATTPGDPFSNFENPSTFPYEPIYWSSTNRDPSSGNYAWYVNFVDGNVHFNANAVLNIGKLNTYFVIAVRGGS